MNSQANRMCMSLFMCFDYITFFSWSFGVLLYELFTMGETPYSTVQPADMIEYLESGHRLPKPEPLCPTEMYVSYRIVLFCKIYFC